MALADAAIGFIAAVCTPTGCGSATLEGDLVHGMNCLRTIKYDGEAVLLLTNRPTDSGQDVTDRELQQFPRVRSSSSACGHPRVVHTAARHRPEAGLSNSAPRPNSIGEWLADYASRH
jgi:hypothetical protein